MPNISLEEIQNYIKNNPNKDLVELNFESFTLPVKTNLTIEEKLSFVESVVKDSFTNMITPSLILNDIAFTINFVLAVCPDFPFPTKEVDDEFVIDTQSSYDIIQSLDFINKYMNTSGNHLYCELREYVKDRMDFEKQKLIAFASLDNAPTEAIKTFSSTFYRLDKLINVTMSQLEKNGNKLFKKLTDKNIDKWIVKFAESYKKTIPNDSDDINYYD